MKKECIRCSRRFKGVSLCLDCELYLNRQEFPGYKTDQRRRALKLLSSGRVARIRPGVYRVTSKGNTYKTAASACTCPSGRYRGLYSRICFHQCAAEMINRKETS